MTDGRETGRGPVRAGAGDLERRLLEFVSRLEPREGAPPLPIDADTALFEEGIIDSLRLLDLIAFVEEETGRRIPDAEVRLANFRSVRAITTAFGECGPTADERPVVVFTRRAARSTAVGPLPELAARGELSLFLPGRAVFHGPPARLLEAFDDVVRSWAAELGAPERRYPVRVPGELLARAGRPVDPPPAGPVHPSAVCYHVYDALAGRRLESVPVLVTTRGRCFRDESRFDPAHGRLRVFEMREIVAVGSRADAERLRRELIGRVQGLLEELDLAGRIETANDPFFLAEADARGRRLMQRLLPLKYELRLPVDGEEPDCAVASFNHHLDFFGRRFDIRLPSGTPAHSGCVAFGLERWVLAFLARHGTNPGGWPALRPPIRDPSVREVSRARVP